MLHGMSAKVYRVRDDQRWPGRYPLTCRVARRLSRIFIGENRRKPYGVRSRRSPKSVVSR